MKRITVCISTKNRRHILHQTLWSLRNQTYPWFDIVVVDDSDDTFKEESWTEDQFYSAIIKELQQKHKVKFISSPKSGKVGASFQAGYLWSQKEWGNQLLCRCDDDVWLEPTYLEKLAKAFDNPEVGAASGLMLNPGSDIQYMAKDDSRYERWNRVATITNDGNLQWFRHEADGPFEVEYLHSTQMIRTSVLKIIGGFDTGLFDNYREENHLSWRAFIEGYKVLIIPQAEAWHLRSPSGGTRSGRNSWIDDCRKFSMIKKSMAPGIHLSLTHAIGDLIMATPMLEELRKKYPDRNISVWHPLGKEVLEGNPNVDVICKNAFDGQRTYRIEESVYSWAAKNNHSAHLANAYCGFVGVPEIENPLPKLYNIEPSDKFQNYIVITPASNAKVYDFSEYSRTKHWSPDRWDEIIRWAKEKWGVEVVHLSGEEVSEYFNDTTLVNDVSFREAFSIIAGARCLISIDTMAHHAAAALDVPSVVLWGRTSPAMYGYDKDNIINLYNQCPKNSPCFGGQIYQQDKSTCPIPKHPCMDHSVEDVKKAIEAVIRG
jgi:GT2 family glycosyltransferase